MLDGAKSGPVAEGNVGGGTGMICYEFKGGIGTSSRRLGQRQGGYTVGVLVQANHGSRGQLRIAGVPVGSGNPRGDNPAQGSRLDHHRRGHRRPALAAPVERLARRTSMGLCGPEHLGERPGDIFLAFSTANPEAGKPGKVSRVEMLPLDRMDPLFEATVQATEEAIVNALVAAETMRGSTTAR